MKLSKVFTMLITLCLIGISSNSTANVHNITYEKHSHNANQQKKQIPLYMVGHILKAELLFAEQKNNEAINIYNALLKKQPNAYLANKAAKLAMLDENPKVAEQAARNWVTLDNDNLNARVNLILTLFEQNKSSEISAHLIKILNSKHDSLDIIKSLLSIYSYLPDTQLAVYLSLMENLPSFEQNLQLKENTTYLQILSKFYLANHQYEKAYLIANNLFKQNPQDFSNCILYLEANNGLYGSKYTAKIIKRNISNFAQFDNWTYFIEFFVKNNNLTGAKHFLSNVVKYCNDDHEKYLEIAEIAANIGWPDLAKQALIKNLKFTGNPYQTQFYLGKIAEHEKKYSEAKKIYSAISEGPYRIQAQLRLANILSTENNSHKALQILSQITTNDFQLKKEIYLSKTKLHFLKQDYSQSIATAKQALYLFQEDPELNLLLSMSYEEVNEIATAEKHLKQILTKDQNNVSALTRLGNIFLEHHQDLDAAKSTLSKAIRLAPANPCTIRAIGKLHHAEGNPTEAIAWLQHSLNLEYNAQTSAMLSKVLWDIGEKKAAIKHLNQAIKKLPNNETILKMLDKYTRG